MIKIYKQIKKSFFNIKTKLNESEVLETLKLLDFDYLNLKDNDFFNIFNRIKFLNDFFNYSFYKQKQIENEVNEILDEINLSSLLLNDLISKTEKEVSIYNYIKNNNYFDLKNNFLLLDLPVYCEEIMLYVDKCFIDKDYNFTLIVEFVKDNIINVESIDILPYNYSGDYFEIIKKDSGIFESKFNYDENEEIYFKDSYDNIKDVYYEVKNQKIIYDTSKIINDIKIFYKPSVDSTIFKIDGSLLSITLLSNYDSKKSRIITIGVDNFDF